MREWLRLAAEATVVTRALKYAVGVGALLIAINHGDDVVRGHVDGVIVAKMALTVCVPYMVSTLSSVGALRDARRRGREGEGK